MSKEPTYMTKERILGILKRNITSPDHDGYFVTEEALNKIVETAKQEARTEAIAFAEWVEENEWWFDYWICQDESETKNKSWNNDSTTPKNLTTEQLYNLFTKQ